MESSDKELNPTTTTSYSPFPNQLANGLHFEVKKHSKLKRIVLRARKELETKTVSRLIFHGVGDGCEKCVSCVEILKKAINEPLYQWNCLTAKKIPSDSIEDVAAEKCIPEIFVMISREQYAEEYRSSSQQMSTDLLPSVLNPPGNPQISKGKGKKRKMASNKWRRPEKRSKIKANK